MLDYISSLLLIIGYFIVGNKNKNGWLLSSVGNLGYIFVGYISGLYGMMILSIVMLSVSIINYIKWNKNE